MKNLTITILTLALLSCDNDVEEKQVKNAMQEAVKQVKEVPKIKKEMEKAKKAIEEATLDGKLSMTIDGEELALTSWSKKKSYLRFFDNKIVVRASHSGNNGQSVAIKVNGNNLFGAQDSGYKTMDLGLVNGAYAEFAFYDDAKKGTGSPVVASSGEFTLTALNGGDFKISYTGKGKMGKYEATKEIDLAMNFHVNFSKELIKDNRSK